MNQPVLFLVGTPAAGKSTLRRRIYEHCRPTVPGLLSLGDDEALRALYPPPGDPTGLYWYEDTDRLILRPSARPVLHSRALRHLGTTALTSIQDHPLIIEFAHPYLEHAFALVGRTLLIGALVLYLDAPADIRLARNRARGRDRLPDDAILFDRNAVALGPFVASAGGHLQHINSGIDLDLTWAAASSVAVPYLESPHR